jgi:toxin-antitoxin system PIN domain toxin
MTGYLLDVNVLIALLWPTHESHAQIRPWFHRHAGEGWVTCPFTQAGFVRIVSNPAFFPNAVGPQEAINILAANLKDPRHRFWANDVSFPEAIEVFSKRLVGHKQVTDSYLLGLALHKKGRLVSFDRGLLELLPEKGMQPDLVTLL